MPSDIENSILLDDVITVEGVGDIRVKLDQAAFDKRPIYLESLKISRKIKSPELVDIGDVISLFYIVYITRGYSDPQLIEELKNKRRFDVAAETAETAVQSARDYHRNALMAANSEALMVAAMDSIFKVERDPQTRRPIISAADGITLPEIPEGYFKDTGINSPEERELLGQPPRFVRSPDNPVEQKVAYISVLMEKNPIIATKFNEYFSGNLVQELQSRLLADNSEEESVDTETGFHPEPDDRNTDEPDDAVSE